MTKAPEKFSSFIMNDDITKAIDIQNHFLSLTDDNFTSKLDILNSLLKDTHSKRLVFVSLYLAISSRINQWDLFIKIISFLKIGEEFCSYSISTYLTTPYIRVRLGSSCYRRFSVIVAFFYRLVKENIMDVNEHIIKYFLSQEQLFLCSKGRGSRKMCGDIYIINKFVLFFWFWKEIGENTELLHSKYFYMNQTFPTNFLSDCFFDKPASTEEYWMALELHDFIHFRKNYKEMKENDWKLFLEIRENGGFLNNTVEYYISHDMVDEMQQLLSNSKRTINSSNVDISVFTYKLWGKGNKSLNIIECAAMFGSVKCFKYLFLNGGPKLLEEISCCLDCAIVGGNAEIIRIMNQNKCPISYAIEISIEKKYGDVFLWLFDNFCTESYLHRKRFPFNNLAVFSLYVHNYDIIRCLLDKNFDFPFPIDLKQINILDPINDIGYYHFFEHSSDLYS